ncbi:MAG: hypothetical protein ACJAYU_002611 [Bradymonadia bacterium]
MEEFFRSVPEFERTIVKSGIILIKYWSSITDEEQNRRFNLRITDPLKQWKLSPMDLESRVRWEKYSAAKEAMSERTHIPEAKWWIIAGNNKKKARLNCISHLLTQVPHHEIERPDVIVSERVHNPDYSREPIPPAMHVPDKFSSPPEPRRPPRSQGVRHGAKASATEPTCYTSMVR